MIKDEALKLALEALEVVEPHTFPDSAAELFSRSAITACREALAQPTSGDYALGYSIGFGDGHSAKEALAQPEQKMTYQQAAQLINEMKSQPEHEPVAYGMWDTMLGKENRMMMVRLDKGQDGCNVPLYTTPPQRTWVGLTDDEIDQGLLRSDYAFKTAEAWRAGVVFAMTKLKQKNGYAEQKNNG